MPGQAPRSAIRKKSSGAAHFWGGGAADLLTPLYKSGKIHLPHLSGSHPETVRGLPGKLPSHRVTVFLGGCLGTAEQKPKPWPSIIRNQRLGTGGAVRDVQIDIIFPVAAEAMAEPGGRHLQ